MVFLSFSFVGTSLSLVFFVDNFCSKHTIKIIVLAFPFPSRKILYDVPAQNSEDPYAYYLLDEVSLFLDSKFHILINLFDARKIYISHFVYSIFLSYVYLDCLQVELQ